MANISLATYTVLVNRKGRHAKEALGNIETQDLLSILQDFLNDRSTPENNTLAKHLIQVTHYTVKDREVVGQIDTGDYGFGARLVNTTDATVAYTRRISDAEMLPFFFLCHLPKDEKTGILIFQRFKGFGIRKLFVDGFGEYFSKRLPDFTLRVEPIVPNRLLGGLTNSGKVSRVRFREYRIPKDVCDAFTKRIGPEDGYREYSIVVRQNLTFGDVAARIRGSGKSALLSVPLPKNFNPNAVLVEVEINGKRRTVNISNLRKLRAYFDITNEVKPGQDGHPDFDSIAEISRSLLKDLWEELRGSHAVQQD